CGSRAGWPGSSGWSTTRPRTRCTTRGTSSSTRCAPGTSSLPSAPTTARPWCCATSTGCRCPRSPRTSGGRCTPPRR
ncbi:MAG: hypothetical protein AVDCRST_MAG24-1444, partial [uncultured Nocardioidaceae bacterium]